MLKLGLLGLERDTTNAAAAAVGKLVGEAWPLGIAQYSTATKSEVEESSGEALGLLGPAQTTRLALTMQQLQKLSVKLGLLGSPSTVSRLQPCSQCLVVKPGSRGPERRTRPVRTLQRDSLFAY